MKYYIIAGERSGDLHGSNLIKNINKRDPNATIRGFGGDLMNEAGMELVIHYHNLAFMGLIEVIINIRKISAILRKCKKDITAFNPDVIILIDYAGFNLKIAKFAHKRDFKVFYYISPKIWAWKTSRVNTIKKYVDKVYVILPFEVEFFKKYNVQSEYVGNPVVNAVNDHELNMNFKASLSLDENKKIIALLPGSRVHELNKMLPQMVKVAKNYQEYLFVIAGVNNLPKSLYQMADKHDNIMVVYERSYDLLANAHAALVTSGTATLETALWNVPQVVLYKTHPITYEVGRRLVFKNIDYFSLVNLISGKEVVKELLQGEVNPKTISSHLAPILEGPERSKMLDDYQGMRAKLGNYDTAEKASELMINELSLTQP